MDQSDCQYHHMSTTQQMHVHRHHMCTSKGLKVHANKISVHCICVHGIDDASTNYLLIIFLLFFFTSSLFLHSCTQFNFHRKVHILVSLKKKIVQPWKSGPQKMVNFTISWHESFIYVCENRESQSNWNKLGQICFIISALLLLVLLCFCHS